MHPDNRTKFTLLILNALAIFFFAGCALFGGGSDIERADDYSVTAPGEWEKTSTGGESDQAYRLPSGSIATLTSSCQRNPKAGLETLTRQLLIGSRNIRFDKKETLTVAGDEGLFSRVRNTVDGRPFYLALFVLRKPKCVFDFSLVNPQPIPDGDVTQFLNFIRTFKYGRD